VWLRWPPKEVVVAPKPTCPTRWAPGDGDVRADDFVRALSEKGKRRSRIRSRANERKEKEETKEKKSPSVTDAAEATSSDEGSARSPARDEEVSSETKLKADLQETSEGSPVYSPNIVLVS
ncbi:hypothetical protein FOZ63_003714, partial [Perkinsus olseni]